MMLFGFMGRARAQTLTHAEVLEDLTVLRDTLETRYSYLKLKDVDYRAALDQLATSAANGMDRAELGRALMKLLARFGDGHTRLADEREFLPRAHMPFLVGETAGRMVAFKPDRSDFIDPQRPFLMAIDGVPIERWLAAAVPMRGGSAQFERVGSIENLRFIQYLRGELGLPASPKLTVELASTLGSYASHELDVTPVRPLYGSPPELDQRILPGNVGYLGIGDMEDDREFVAALLAAMQRLRDTRALVIDVRGNGGGSRDALRLLFPFFMAPDDPPRIANVAVYRMGPEDPPGATEGYLENRFLYPVTSRQWTPEDRRAIEAFAGRFAPGWSFPQAEFSAYHYFVLKAQSVPEAYHYRRPVALLIDEKCFSATDVFVGAFKGWRNVTVIGTATGGGSGRARGLQLPRSRISLQYSTMVSFQPSGALYDGLGVEPDIMIQKTPGDWLRRTDTVLEAALEHLENVARADGGAPADDGGPAHGDVPADSGAPAPTDGPAGCECRALPGSTASGPAAILVASVLMAFGLGRRRGQR